MKKFLFALILISSAFLLLGCQSGGKAIAGQWEPTQELQGGFEMPYQPVDYTDYTHPEMPVEYVGEVQGNLPCKMDSVTVTQGKSASGSGPDESSARINCIKNLNDDLWIDAGFKCQEFVKTDGKTVCTASKGNTNMDKDFIVENCAWNEPSRRFICDCRLNKDKDFICNGH